MRGNEGDDRIRSDVGDDTMIGGPGRDTITASPSSVGDDTIYGGPGADELYDSAYGPEQCPRGILGDSEKSARTTTSRSSRLQAIRLRECASGSGTGAPTGGRCPTSSSTIGRWVAEMRALGSSGVLEHLVREEL